MITINKIKNTYFNDIRKIFSAEMEAGLAGFKKSAIEKAIGILITCIVLAIASFFTGKHYYFPALLTFFMIVGFTAAGIILMFKSLEKSYYDMIEKYGIFSLLIQLNYDVIKLNNSIEENLSIKESNN